jgi:catechol 2,3-dioxygenase-like lactoylglutathione lyase family enzyme
MHIIELNHVALEVADLSSSILFYRQLGLPLIPRPAFDFKGAWFRLGSVQELHLIAGREKPVNSAKRGSHFALRVQSLEEAIESLRKSGIAFQGPFDRPDGARQIFLTDPDGYVIELCQI